VRTFLSFLTGTLESIFHAFKTGRSVHCTSASAPRPQRRIVATIGSGYIRSYPHSCCGETGILLRKICTRLWNHVDLRSIGTVVGRINSRLYLHFRDVVDEGYTTILLKSTSVLMPPNCSSHTQCDVTHADTFRGARSASRRWHNGRRRKRPATPKPWAGAEALNGWAVRLDRLHLSCIQGRTALLEMDLPRKNSSAWSK